MPYGVPQHTSDYLRSKSGELSNIRRNESAPGLSGGNIAWSFTLMRWRCQHVKFS
jgi:hypothetical protein